MAFPSTFLDIQNAVINELRLDSTADLSAVKDWVNQRYAQVVVETQAKQGTTTINFVAGTDTYTLASTIERIINIYVTPVGALRSRALQLTSIEDIINRKVGTTTSSDQGYLVTHYALLGIDQLVVWPTPQAADVATVYYVSLPTALSGNTDVPILHEPWASKLLFYGACADAASFKGDPDQQNYAALFEMWLGRYRTHLNRKRGESTTQFRIASGPFLPPHDPSTDIFRSA